MNARRVVLLITGLIVAGLGGVFGAVQWDRANWIASAVSALAAVAALGIAVWAALLGSRSGSGSTVRVSGTGKAIAGSGGSAVSGMSGPAGSVVGSIEVENTGDADASEGGDATTGVGWT